MRLAAAGSPRKSAKKSGAAADEAAAAVEVSSATAAAAAAAATAATAATAAPSDGTLSKRRKPRVDELRVATISARSATAATDVGAGSASASASDASTAGASTASESSASTLVHAGGPLSGRSDVAGASASGLLAVGSADSAPSVLSHSLETFIGLASTSAPELPVIRRAAAAPRDVTSKRVATPSSAHLPRGTPAVPFLRAMDGPLAYPRSGPPDALVYARRAQPPSTAMAGRCCGRAYASRTGLARCPC